jgi:hypothetical protein
VRTRIAASVVLAAGIVLGTSACSLMAFEGTNIRYEASDGVSGDVGDVAVRNAMLFSEDGDLANLVVTLVNRGDDEQTVNVQYESGNEKVTHEVTVEGHQTVMLGTEEDQSVIFEGIDAQPGSLFPVFFQYGDETGAELRVPVLVASQPHYSNLLPTLAPTPTPEPTPSGEPTPTPSGEATPTPQATPAS